MSVIEVKNQVLIIMLGGVVWGREEVLFYFESISYHYILVYF